MQLCLVMFLCEMAGYLIYKLCFPSYYFAFFPFLVSLFLILGAMTVSIVTKATEGDKNNYVNIFLMLRVIKLVVLLGVAIVYSFVVRNNLISFFIAFVALYVIYTIYETRFSIKLNKISNDEFNKK